MNIIGISGFENGAAFKRAHWPGLDEREQRIYQGQDAAAALVVDGTPVAAAAEERFDRKKHSAAFPAGAIQYCLEAAKLSIGDIDWLAHGFDYGPVAKLFEKDPLTAELYREVFSREALLASVRRYLPGFPLDRVCQVGHHLAHAASAYYTSGWDRCLVVVIDGMGETESMSVFTGDGGRMTKVRDISVRDSIGILYGLVTLHLGFEFNSDEYKIMGLAPYGDPARFRSFFDSAVRSLPDGSVAVPILSCNRTREERETYSGTRAYLGANLLPPRRPDDEIRQEHCDAAAALQECAERVILNLCSAFRRKTGLSRLALAGGIALNCTANGKLRRSGLFDEIHIQPAAGDDGSALGAALHRAAACGKIENRRCPLPLYGPEYDERAMGRALDLFRERIRVTRYATSGEACARAAELIASGSVLGWFRGRMEFGPRALGNRSILADPGRPEMRDRINSMVKKREAFRPFAPAVSAEQVHIWFDAPPATSLPHMVFSVDVRPEYRRALPAVTHVNGSARVQTVSEADNQDFHRLLQEVGRTTGREVVLNTSFNVKGQPIVNSPEEAIETFLSTGIDVLFIGNTEVNRP